MDAAKIEIIEMQDINPKDVQETLQESVQESVQENNQEAHVDIEGSNEDALKDIFQAILANQTDNDEVDVIKTEAIKEYASKQVESEWKTRNLEITSSELAQLAVQADTNNDGKVNEQDFINIAIRGNTCKIRLGELFEDLSEGKNKIELKKLIKELDSKSLSPDLTIGNTEYEKIQPQDFAQILYADKDGMIDKEKFVKSAFAIALLRARLRGIFGQISQAANNQDNEPIEIEFLKNYVSNNCDEESGSCIPSSEFCITPSELLELAEEADTDNDDKISEEEFVTFLIEGDFSKRRLGELFDCLCAGKPNIRINDLKKQIKQLPKLYPSQIDELTCNDLLKFLCYADLDEDGYIDRKEFISSAFSRILLNKKYENKILWKALQIIAYAEIYHFWPPPKFIPILTIIQIIFFYCLSEKFTFRYVFEN